MVCKEELLQLKKYLLKMLVNLLLHVLDLLLDALQDLNAHREVQLVISGGIRNGADVAKL
jgi:hypothetical protein